MTVLKSTVFALLLCFFPGCASMSSRTEHIPYPSSTPFDANVFARNAFLDGFRTGYRVEAYNDRNTPETLSGPFNEARRLGFYAGMGQAQYEKANPPSNQDSKKRH